MPPGHETVVSPGSYGAMLLASGYALGLGVHSADHGCLELRVSLEFALAGMDWISPPPGFEHFRSLSTAFLPARKKVRALL